MNIGQYLEQVRTQYASGHATEHSYRPALHTLFEGIDPRLTVINEPKKSEAGMPDFLFQRGAVPIGWAEAKDIDKDVIRLKGYSVEQRKRYEKAYPNLIYTNGVDFEFIREEEPVHFVSIASFGGPLGGLQPLPDKFDDLARQLKRFAEQKPISIRSAAKLAEIMAAKAAIIKDEIQIALADDREFRSGLGGQYKSFKANLLPHLTPDEFARYLRRDDHIRHVRGALPRHGPGYVQPAGSDGGLAGVQPLPEGALPVHCGSEPP